MGNSSIESTPEAGGRLLASFCTKYDAAHFLSLHQRSLNAQRTAALVAPKGCNILPFSILSSIS